MRIMRQPHFQHYSFPYKKLYSQRMHEKLTSTNTKVGNKKHPLSFNICPIPVNLRV